MLISVTNKLPSSKSLIERIETLAEKYILLDSLFFKITPEKETAVLAVPEMCRQDHNPISFKLICRTPRSFKDIFDH